MHISGDKKATPRYVVCCRDITQVLIELEILEEYVTYRRNAGAPSGWIRVKGSPRGT